MIKFLFNFIFIKAKPVKISASFLAPGCCYYCTDEEEIEIFNAEN